MEGAVDGCQDRLHEAHRTMIEMIDDDRVEAAKEFLERREWLDVDPDLPDVPPKPHRIDVSIVPLYVEASAHLANSEPEKARVLFAQQIHARTETL